MAITRTLGGDRLGSGKKMQIDMHGYERSNQNKNQVIRTTAAPGTLIPFFKEVGLPGDTFDIDLNVDIRTLPTIGPLFGSFKVQLDIFSVPWRLYNSYLHNNKLGVGLNMGQIKLPTLTMTAKATDLDLVNDIDNSQINPSSILKYLGLSGVGYAPTTDQERDFNAIPLLAYWDIVKCYYSNKQEEIGAVIHCGNGTTTPQTITDVMVERFSPNLTWTLEEAPAISDPITLKAGDTLTAQYTGATPDPRQVYIKLQNAGLISLYDLWGGTYVTYTDRIQGVYNATRWGEDNPINWQYSNGLMPMEIAPNVVTFPLENIDTMREEILSYAQTASAYNVNSADLAPYKYVYGSATTGMTNILCSQEGLAVKTYQSDLFNNWLRTEYIEYINTVSSVSTAGGSFSIDSLNLASKVFNLLNRVAVSGGTYVDWVETVYDEEMMRQAETPMWMGGLIDELVFQEVVSQSLSESQPLGTLAGTGKMKRNGAKGGHVIVKVKEPSYIIGIFSLTPRIDYSQGNDWDLHLQSFDDLHKPQLDQIGWEDSINERRAWWSTKHTGTDWAQTSAGKVPAWIEYTTAVNKTFGNFAIADNQMFMTLNRRYEFDDGDIADLTTYIHPDKFNFIFAETALDAQNFWVQIGTGCQVRRKMSARLIPNL